MTKRTPPPDPSPAPAVPTDDSTPQPERILFSGREWLKAIRARYRGDLPANSPGYYAEVALKYWEEGDLDRAFHYAMLAAWWAGLGSQFEVQAHLQPHWQHEENRINNLKRHQESRAEAYKRRVDDAVNRLDVLLSSNSRGWRQNVKDAAEAAGIGDRAFRKHLKARSITRPKNRAK